MKKLLLLVALSATALSLNAQKDEFAGFYQGKYGDDAIFAEVFKAHNDTYRLRLYTDVIKSKGDLLLEISALKAENGAIKAEGEHDAHLTILPAEVNGNFNDSALSLAKLNYISETMGLKPAEGAIVLFDGKDLNTHWTMGKKEMNWIIKDGVATIDSANSSSILSKETYGAMKMHLEFKTPPVYNEEKQQKRGNSGIKFGPYEIQILDSFGTADYNNYDVGSIYSLTAPAVNAALEPDAWQSYDIEFTPVKYSEDGEIVALPRFTVYLNGVLVQDNVEVASPTNAKEKKNQDFKHPEKVQLQLQNHKHDVSFRNIWIVEKP